MQTKQSNTIKRRAKQKSFLYGTRLLLSLVLLCAFSSYLFAQASDEAEVVRVNTDLVNLNVGVFSRERLGRVGELQSKDFTVLENGVAQEIAFFASASTPFDLVLLLDLSGSTADKLNLVRRSAAQFVEAARPTDRIGIVTFTATTQLVSPLTSDRAQLLASIKRIARPAGGTKFWDALRCLLEKPDGGTRNSSRRSAIVAMTDGVDNAIADVPGDGSETDFGKLLEIVRRSDFILLPIYLDTEKEMVKQHRVPASAYFYARQQLQLLAEESGSPVYTARKLEDLQNVYTQVIHDLSTVYSIGYRPANKRRDGSYRSINVRLATHPDLIARTRRGYYAGQ